MTNTASKLKRALCSMVVMLALVAGITSIPVLAASNGIYTATATSHYKHPTTGVIEDSGGEFYGDGVIDKPIIRPDPMKTLRDVGMGGERAVTHWKSLKVKDGCTLLRIHLETGRTHQIRVHFKSLGAPLVGDDMYGSTDKRLSHQALHCCFVRFTHPVTEKIMEFTAPMPDDMNKLT